MNNQIIHQNGSSGQPTMTSLEIAELTGKRHDHVIRDIREMIDSMLDAPDLGNQLNRGLTEHKDARGYTSHFDLDRFAAELLITGYDVVRRARVLNRLVELETQVHKPIEQSKVTAELALMECYTGLLNPAPSSQVYMLQQIAKNNGLDPSFLPQYAVDEPADTATGSSLPTMPITALLNDRGINCSAIHYNKLLNKAGLLVRLGREAKSGVKRYWSVTKDGLNYGKNITSPQNNRETQPHWFESRFDELHEKVLAANGGVL